MNLALILKNRGLMSLKDSEFSQPRVSGGYVEILPKNKVFC